MKNPLFFVEKHDEKGAVFHYKSKRRGFNNYVIGQLKEIGYLYYKKQVDISIVEDRSDDDYNYVVFRVDFDNSATSGSENVKRIKAPLPSLNYDFFFKLFPFSIGFDEDLIIQHTGSIYNSLFDQNLLNNKLTDVFDIVRPFIELNWQSILLLSNSIIFEITNKISFTKNNAQNDSPKAILKIKGQMKFFEQYNLIFFLGHPL
jgi:hypothetical protein